MTEFELSDGRRLFASQFYYFLAGRNNGPVYAGRSVADAARMYARIQNFVVCKNHVYADVMPYEGNASKGYTPSGIIKTLLIHGEPICPFDALASYVLYPYRVESLYEANQEDTDSGQEQSGQGCSGKGDAQTDDAGCSSDGE